MTRVGPIGGKPLRFSLLLAGAGLISMGIFALVPLLLRQTSYPSHHRAVSYALLIPIKPELPPDPILPEQDLKPLPEAPEPPEPEFKSETPELPEMEPPELETPEVAPPEMTLATVDMPPLETPTLEPVTPDPPQLQAPSLQAVSLSALPVQSSPMNLKVDLRVGKVPVPKAFARPVPRKPVTQQTRVGLNEVDQKPVSIATLRPHYPYRARRMGIEGVVTVQFLVDREGKPREITIVHAEPEDIFNQAVRQTVPRWRFKPGKKAGRPVETWVEMTIRFELGHDG